MNKLMDFLQTYKTRLEFITPIVYLFVLVLTSLYIHSALKTTELEVKELPEKEEVKNVNRKEIDIRILIFDTDKKLTQEVVLPDTDNTDTINEVLEEARKKNLVYYEKVNYVYGSEIEKVLNLTLPEGYSWKVYFNNEDITHKIDEVSLLDKDDQREIIIRPLKLK